MAPFRALVPIVSALALLLQACSGGNSGSGGSAPSAGSDLSVRAAGGPEDAGPEDGTGSGGADSSTPSVGSVSPGPPAPERRPVTVTSVPALTPLPAAGTTSSTVGAPPTTTGLPPGTTQTVIGRSTLRFADPPGTTPSERPLVETYHRFLRGLLSSTDPPDPDNGDLAATMSPDYLAKERERLELMRAEGQFTVGDYQSNPRLVRTTTGDVVRIEDCALDSGVRFSSAGQPLRAAATAFSRTVAELDRSSGRWLVRSWNGTGEVCQP